ncbi:hypothetical protein TNIN_395421 [Trichonephila inaurata madagascariensis]|uniref:Uncharacterized protein n=1 Tax=Trichonephila inaurata madagascariensis TaxID=2747483 RepID=A0A8X6K3M7_9ARAC|nr:hypothetical protein TNIN_395421 [Trichonephila inaurata madagascariensis]
MSRTIEKGLKSIDHLAEPDVVQHLRNWKKVELRELCLQQVEVLGGCGSDGGESVLGRRGGEPVRENRLQIPHFSVDLVQAAGEEDQSHEREALQGKEKEVSRN